MKRKITAMLIMAQERRLPLLEALESCGIDVLPVCNCDEGQRMLEIQPQVQVVLTDAALPDGDGGRCFKSWLKPASTSK
jgi:CheY-like chemotaxis protein